MPYSIFFPSCPDSCKRDWSKIRKFRQKCDALTASALAFALNAIHHDFGIVIGFGGDLPGLCVQKIRQFIDDHDLYRSNLCSCQVGAYGHGTVITVAVNKRTNDRLRFVPCSISLRNGKDDFSFHDVAWEKILDGVFG